MSDVKNNTTETEVCEACGTIVELGSVISPEDTVLELPFAGTDLAGVKSLAQKYIDAAKARYETVEVETTETTTETGTVLDLKLTFECAAEKIIFEMALSTI